MKKLLFPRPLAEGLIKSRPNRFIMNVEVGGATIKCHCPSTGRIGSIRFEDVPCLLSQGGVGRKTPYTVEAISLDAPGRRKKRWIGINQTRANDYVAFFLREGALGDMFPDIATIAREVKLGDSRIDFLVNGRDYVEVKMPLNDLPCEGHPNYIGRDPRPISYERIVKHFTDVGNSISAGSRAIFLLCYGYDAPPFTVPVPRLQERLIVDAARKATDQGLENWQINFAIDAEGVALLCYFRLQLFP
jgi:sugar fermentation stimulation protein A